MDFEYIKVLAEQLNILQLIAIAIMFWFFYGRLDQKIEKLDQKLSSQNDKLDEKLTDVDRRLCRLEGAFASKDYCMIKDDHQHKKAE